MKTMNQPDYLPKPFMPEEEYQQLYATNFGVDEFELEREEVPILIDPAMTAEEVYRMLLSSPDFEFGGFITRNEIRYQKCGETWEHTGNRETCSLDLGIGLGRHRKPMATFKKSLMCLACPKSFHGKSSQRNGKTWLHHLVSN